MKEAPLSQFLMPAIHRSFMEEMPESHRQALPHFILHSHLFNHHFAGARFYKSYDRS